MRGIPHNEFYPIGEGQFPGVAYQGADRMPGLVGLESGRVANAPGGTEDGDAHVDLGLRVRAAGPGASPEEGLCRHRRIGNPPYAKSDTFPVGTSLAAPCPRTAIKIPCSL